MMVTSVLSLFLDHFGKGLTMLGMFLRLRLTHLAVPEAVYDELRDCHRLG